MRACDRLVDKPASMRRTWTCVHMRAHTRFNMRMHTPLHACVCTHACMPLHARMRLHALTCLHAPTHLWELAAEPSALAARQQQHSHLALRTASGVFGAEAPPGEVRAPRESDDKAFPSLPFTKQNVTRRQPRSWASRIACRRLLRRVLGPRQTNRTTARPPRQPAAGPGRATPCAPRQSRRQPPAARRRPRAWRPRRRRRRWPGWR
jgi:hypothetical protein